MHASQTRETKSYNCELMLVCFLHETSDVFIGASYYGNGGIAAAPAHTSATPKGDRADSSNAECHIKIMRARYQHMQKYVESGKTGHDEQIMQMFRGINRAPQE